MEQLNHEKRTFYVQGVADLRVASPWFYYGVTVLPIQKYRNQ
jgi:hypothetical protein